MDEHYICFSSCSCVCCCAFVFADRRVKRAEGEFRNGNTAKSGVRRMGKNVVTAN